jgi:hypothetical protein
MTMKTMMTKGALAIAVAGAMTIGVASPSWAAPVLSNTAAVKAAAPNAVTDVRYYGNGYRRGYRNNGGLIVGGLALGAIGAVAGQRYYRGDGYYRDGYYGDRAYAQPYGYRSYGYEPGYGDYGQQRGW